MNETKLSEMFIGDFFPCTTMNQLQFTEMIIFGMLPGLKTFSRDITPVELAAGVIYPHALVTKTPDGIIRDYGTSLAKETLV